jgi:DNA-binding CsgD family transcriptional regulator
MRSRFDRGWDTQHMNGDVLSIIEAGYAESADADEWLDGALAAMHAQLDQGGGVLARRFHVQPTSLWQGATRAIGVAPEDVAATDRAAAWLTDLPPLEAMAVARQMFPLAPVAARLSHLIGPAMMTHLVTNFSRPVTDSLGVIAADPSGHGCVFFRIEDKARPVSRRATDLWERTAAHLVTGYRLARERHGKTEAVLDPGGKVLHRENDVTRDDASTLSDAAKGIDRARGRLRRVDPERALALWKGLVSGRWSLVDHFDSDGRRFVVAKRNAITSHAWSALTEREGQILAYLAEGQAPKLIAYQLGLSTTTVSADLSRIMRKLSVGSRFELITAYRAHRSQQESA